MLAGPVLGKEVDETAAAALTELTPHPQVPTSSVLGLRAPSVPMSSHKLLPSCRQLTTIKCLLCSRHCCGMRNHAEPGTLPVIREFLF